MNLNWQVIKRFISHWIVTNKNESIGLVYIFLMIVLGNFTIFAGKGSNIDIVQNIPVLFRNADAIHIGTSVYSYGVKIGNVTSMFLVSLKGNNKIANIIEEQYEKSHEELGVLAILSIDRKIIFYPNYRIVTQNVTILSEKKIELYTGNGANWNIKNLPGNAHEFDETMNPEKPISHLKLNKKEIIKFKKTGNLPNRDIMLLGANYDDPLHLITSTIFENKENLKIIFKDLRELTFQLKQNNGTIGELINSPELLDQLNEILISGIYLVNEAHDGLESLRESNLFVGMVSPILKIGSAYIATEGFTKSLKQASIDRGWAPEIALMPQLSIYRSFYRKDAKLLNEKK